MQPDRYREGCGVSTTDRAKTQNLAQFAAERGLVTEHDVQSHIHAGLRSAPTTKSYARWFEKRLAALQKARDETRAAYDAAVLAGELTPPARPTLEEKASGHPDNPSTQAARRLLAKRDAA